MRRFVTRLLIPGFLLVAGAACASGDQPGDTDGATVESCCDPAPPMPLDTGKALGMGLEEIADHAESALRRFQKFRLEADLFLGVDADMDDRIIHRTGTLVRNMSALIGKLRETGGDAPGQTLSEQAADTRAAGMRLSLAAGQLDLLMEEQGRCGLRRLGFLLSAVEALALQLEDSPPGGNQAVSELQYFFFRGHLPNVVPADGGWLIAAGAHLWRDGDPRFSLVDDYLGTISGPLEVRRVGAGHAAAVRIEPDLIEANAGRCLRLVAADAPASGMQWKNKPKPGPGESLPVCIPLSFNTRYKVAGMLEYWSPTRTRRHQARSILFENASCTEDKEVSASLEWELHPEGWLIGTGESALYEAGTTSVDCVAAENRVTCQGHLGPAICGQDLRSGDERSLLLEQSEWEHIFSPLEEFPEPEKHHSWALSPSFRLDEPTVHVDLKIPREETSEETTLWYQLIMINGGQKRTLFLSPGKTVTGEERIDHVTAYNRIAAEFTTAADGSEARIGFSIEPAACRY